MSERSTSSLVDRPAGARRAATNHALSFVALAAAVLLRYLLEPWMGGALPLVTLFGAVAMAVWLGGYAPAVIVTILGYLACSYFAAGPRVVRLDRLERAAAVLSRLSRAGPFAPPAELAGILGCRPEELAAVLAALGYDERDGRFERRARRRAEAARRAR